MKNLVRGVLVPVTAAVVLVACGGDDGGSAGTAPSDPGTLPASVPTSAADATTAAVAETTVAPTETTAADGQISGDALEVMVNADDQATAGQVVPVALGQTVVLRLVSDTDREYHVHGYELEGTAPAGTEYTFEFTADQAGAFEVEDHVEDRVVLVLQVG